MFSRSVNTRPQMVHRHTGRPNPYTKKKKNLTPRKPDEDIESPRTGFIDGCDTSCGQGLNLEQSVLLTIEPHFLPPLPFSWGVGVAEF